MSILALDTSTFVGAIALKSSSGGQPRIAPQDPGRPHGKELLATIAAMLEAESLSPSNLQAIGVGLGPGSYTGLRIGLTAAKTLAFSLDRPLIPLDSLDAIAANAPREFLRIDVALDAQRGDVYLARYLRGSDGAWPDRIGPTEICRMDDWVDCLDPQTYVIGPTIDRFRVDWPSGVNLGPVSQGHPNPKALLDSAIRLHAAGQSIEPMSVEPIYLRRSAAEDQWDGRR